MVEFGPTLNEAPEEQVLPAPPRLARPVDGLVVWRCSDVRWGVRLDSAGEEAGEEVDDFMRNCFRVRQLFDAEWKKGIIMTSTYRIWSSGT